MIHYVLKQVTREGLWTSDVTFEAQAERHVNQAVIGGWLSGQPRWAETPDGRFLFGLDGKGKEIKAPPV